VGVGKGGEERRCSGKNAEIRISKSDAELDGEEEIGTAACLVGRCTFGGTAARWRGVDLPAFSYTISEWCSPLTSRNGRRSFEAWQSMGSCGVD
jgi:hypothetical protein